MGHTYRHCAHKPLAAQKRLVEHNYISEACFALHCLPCDPPDRDSGNHNSGCCCGPSSKSLLGNQPQVSYPSTKKMKRLLDFEYELTLEDGLKRTIDWMRRQPSSSA